MAESDSDSWAGDTAIGHEVEPAASSAEIPKVRARPRAKAGAAGVPLAAAGAQIVPYEPPQKRMRLILTCLRVSCAATSDKAWLSDYCVLWNLF